MKLQSVRGTKDILPEESPRWQHCEALFRRVAALYGFQEIRIPVFEVTELFARGMGETTDVVSKEMYTFLDMGKDSLTLRPEATAGIVRAAIEHTLIEKNPVARLWYCGAMFRQERPQKGRYRQFHQFDAELLGAATPEADAEILAFAYQIVRELGIASFEVRLNSLGNTPSRLRYKDLLLEHFRPVRHQLSQDSQNRLERNPMRILDSKHPEDAEFVRSAPLLTDALDDESRAYFDNVQTLLSALGIPFTIDPRLVRGLDYYCHTAFELVTTRLGSQNALGGGGRYDGLFEQLGGKPTPGVGFALGIERLLLLMEEEGKLPQTTTATDVYIVALDAASRERGTQLAFQLRGCGVRVMTDVLARSFKAQMRDADRTGAALVVIIGEHERERNVCIVKTMANGEQQEYPLDAAKTLAALVQSTNAPHQPSNSIEHTLNTGM
jgi:histidyl-tRNA synthetase